MNSTTDNTANNNSNNTTSPSINTTTTTTTNNNNNNNNAKEESFEDQVDNKTKLLLLQKQQQQQYLQQLQAKKNLITTTTTTMDDDMSNDSSLPSINRDYNKEKEEADAEEEEEENHINRFNPYGSTANKKTLNFNERLETIEMVVSMFPLLEKDPSVYKILNRYDWNIEASINEFQKRHDFAEKSLESNKTPSFPQDPPQNLVGSCTTPTPTEMKSNPQHRRAGRPYHSTNLQDDYDQMEELEENLEDSLEDDLDDSTDDFGSKIKDEYAELMEEREGEGGNKSSALDFSRFPNFKQDIQTLRDIFGTTYGEYELKGFYMVCGGNLEVVIDQLVNEQRQKEQALKPNEPTQKVAAPRQPLTSRLSEEDKRQLQLQLIEEQEKLEKKFSDKKKLEISSHPSKKNFSQQEIVNELKDLFGRHVEDGVIEWVAYSCEYDLGKATTQLVDLKHNNLLKKNAAAGNGSNGNSNGLMALDTSMVQGIEGNLNALSKNLIGGTTLTVPTDLISQVSFDTLTEQVGKLNATNDNSNNSNNKNIFNSSPIYQQSDITGGNTTTTTTTTSNNESQKSSSTTPLFLQNFVYDKK